MQWAVGNVTAESVGSCTRPSPACQFCLYNHVAKPVGFFDSASIPKAIVRYVGFNNTLIRIGQEYMP
jgi:hypothetical protein